MLDFNQLFEGVPVKVWEFISVHVLFHHREQKELMELQGVEVKL